MESIPSLRLARETVRTSLEPLNASRKPNRGRPASPFDDRVLPALRAIRSRIGLGARIRTRSYDQRLIEPSLKTGNLLGMGTTESKAEVTFGVEYIDGGASEWRWTWWRVPPHRSQMVHVSTDV